MSEPEFYDQKFIDVMSRRVGDTAFCALEVYMLGERLLNWVNATATLGHTSPGSTLDYIPANGELSNDMLRDFIAWTSGRKSLAPGCEERLREHNTESGWSQHVAKGVSKRILPPPLRDTA